MRLGGGRQERTLETLDNDDPVRYATVAAAIIPDMVRNALKDHMAENGRTEEDVEEMARRAHRRSRGSSPQRG